MTKVEIRRLIIEDYEAMINVWKLAELPYRPKGRDSRENTAKHIDVHPDFTLALFLERN